MKITFYVENGDYLDYVISTDEHGEVIENHIKQGDILEGVQLHAYFIECWDKVDGKKTKELKHIKLDIYSFSGEITKIKEEDEVFELMVDCTLPIRMRLNKYNVSTRKIKKGDFISGAFRLQGFICYDLYTLKEKIKGKVVEIERFEIPLRDYLEYIIFITLETI